MVAKSTLTVGDDTSPYISYLPNPSAPNTSWWLDTGAQYSIGNFGSIYNGTQHGTDTNGTMLTFFFIGTGFEIYGRGDFVGTNNGSYSPTLHCAIDGVTVVDTNFTLVTPRSDNQLLCKADSLVDDGHNVAASISTDGQPLWIDYILVEPTNATKNLQDYTRVVRNSDQSITYSDDWSLGVTRKKGATLKVDFIGAAITWYTTLGPVGFSSNASSSGTYSIDGQAEATFAIPWSADYQYFQPLFSVTNLSTGSHSLSVTYQGDAETQVFLTLDHFLILPDNGTPTSAPPNFSSASGSTSSSISLTPTLNSNSTSKSGPPIAAIVGGAVGGGFAIIVLFLLWLLHRKRSSPPSHPRMSLILDDSPVLPEPFITSPVEPGPTILSLPSSPSMRQADLSSGITTSLSRPASPALRSSLMRSNSYEQAHSVITGSSASQTNPGPGSSVVKADTGSRLRLVHHEDSGNRFNQGEETVVEVPPGYTES